MRGQAEHGLQGTAPYRPMPVTAEGVLQGIMPTIIRNAPECDPYTWVQPHRQCGAALMDGGMQAPRACGEGVGLAGTAPSDQHAGAVDGSEYAGPEGPNECTGYAGLGQLGDAQSGGGVRSELFAMAAGWSQVT